MKQFLHIMLALVLLLSLTACGGQENDAPPLYAPAHVESIREAGAFSEELEELDSDTAFSLYKLAGSGLDREDLMDIRNVAVYQFTDKGMYSEMERKLPVDGEFRVETFTNALMKILEQTSEVQDFEGE